MDPLILQILAGVAVFVCGTTALLWALGGGRREAGRLGQAGASILERRFPWTCWMSPGTAKAIVVVIVLILGLSIVALFSGVGAGLSLSLAVLGVVGPVFLMAAQEKSWSESFEEQLPRAAIQIADNARAGLSLPNAVERVVENAHEPIRSVLMLVVTGTSSGLAFNDAFAKARDHVGTKDMSLVTEAITTCYERGGPLPEILERISTALVELRRFRGKVMSATSGARMSIKIMLATPVFILLLLWSMEPKAIELLFNTFLGWVILFFVAGMVGVAYWWSKSIMKQFL